MYGHSVRKVCACHGVYEGGIDIEVTECYLCVWIFRRKHFNAFFSMCVCARAREREREIGVNFLYYNSARARHIVCERSLFPFCLSWAPVYV
jgi:hypothetical protein